MVQVIKFDKYWFYEVKCFKIVLNDMKKMEKLIDWVFDWMKLNNLK